MPSLNKGPNYRTPFGPHNYLRSTRGIQTESFTVAAATVPSETIDGVATKVLFKGEVLAKITSGADIGKVGPFQALATDGRQTVGNIVGLNNTFLPWQLMERDVEVAVVQRCKAVQAWCYERNSGGARITLTNTTADAMRGTKALDILFS